MTDPSPTQQRAPRRRSFSGLGFGVDFFIVAIAALSLVLCATVALIEQRVGHGDVNWTLFALISVLLVITETTSTTWLRFGDGGVVTPSWTFTFSLILLGTPTGAIAMMAITTIIADLHARKAIHKVVFNTTQITLSLAIGALILFAFGVHGPLFTDSALPTERAIAMILSGIVVFGSNGAIICRLLAMIERTNFWTMMRESFVLSMSADAAMLAMAPILVLAARNSLLLLPLIGTATFFVYQTAQHAIQRAHEANHDPLTQLMNRRAFTSALEEFTQSNVETGGAVFILDLDGFKEINDRLGHRTGDHVLQAFAKRLIGALPSSAVVARLGGDEFSVLLTGVDESSALGHARRLHALLDEPLTVDGFPITAGTSIGVANAVADSHAPSELLDAADVAMYRAKRYRSGVEVYESFGTAKGKGRVSLLADLVGAIERNELSLQYQPQVCLRTNRVDVVEALLRWNHPTHGLVMPSDFITLAEHTDLITPLTDFVIETALAEISMLSDSLGVAVNISARNLEDRHFAERTMATLAASGVDPSRLDLEITESAAASQKDRSTVSIEQLRAAGVSVSIDDFGTGYSSYATLRDLSADRIKIDRSFVTNLVAETADATIVRSVIDVAHGLGLLVVAEGIESHDVADLLRTWGCDVAQGFLYARPAPAQLLMHALDEIAAMDVRPASAAGRRAAVLVPAESDITA